VEFHVHTNASLSAMGAMLSQNVTRKNDQPIMHASKVMNRVEQNYNTTHTSLDIIYWVISLSFM
jgi:hypothetical protein